MIKCNKCEEDFTLEVLDELEVIGSGTLAKQCPHCNKITYVKQDDIAEELDISKAKVINFRDDLVEKRELERERAREEEDSEEDEYAEVDNRDIEIDKPPQAIQNKTPFQCLKTVLTNDPNLTEDDIKWILSVAENIYGGIMTINDLEKKIRQLHKKGVSKNIIAERVCDDYVSLINTVLNNNPDYLKDERWIEFLRKEPRAPNPEQVTSSGDIRIKNKGEPVKKKGNDMTLDDVDLDAFLTNQMSMMKKINLIKAMGAGNVPPQIEQMMNNPEMAQKMNDGDGEMGINIDKLLNSYLQNQMILNLTNSMRGGGQGQSQNNGSEEMVEMKRQEHEERMMQMKQEHELRMRKLEEEIKESSNRNKRTTRQPRLTARSRDRSSNNSKDQREVLREAIETAKELEREFGGGKNEARYREELKELRTKLEGGFNQGKFNEYDAQVEKTRAEVEGDTKKADLEHKARMKEAEERRRGYEALANAFERGIGNFGRQMGVGLVSGEPVSAPEGAPAQRKESTLAQEMDEDGNPTGNLIGKCPICGKKVVIEEGDTEIVCEHCNASLNPIPEE